MSGNNKARYSVTIGLAGLYLPNAVYLFTSLHDAIRFCLDEKAMLRDAGYTVSGNIRQDRAYTFNDGNEEIAINDVRGMGLDMDDNYS